MKSCSRHIRNSSSDRILQVVSSGIRAILECSAAEFAVKLNDTRCLVTRVSIELLASSSIRRCRFAPPTEPIALHLEDNRGLTRAHFIIMRNLVRGICSCPLDQVCFSFRPELSRSRHPQSSGATPSDRRGPRPARSRPVFPRSRQGSIAMIDPNI
jgi:hypothetical protein